MVDCQQAAMGGDGKAPAKLKKSKEAFQDLELQTDACVDALQKIRVRIEKELPGFTRQQITRLEKDRGKLTKRADEMRHKYLDLCAAAAVLNEQIRGKQFQHLGNGDMRVMPPDVSFDFTRLQTDEQGAFLQAVENHRADYSSNMKSELDEIDSKREGLEKTLTEGHFSAEAEKLIDAKRPEAPAAEEPEKVQGRPSSTPRTIDYDLRRVEY